LALSQKKSATYEELIALPENLVGELVNGELHVSPRPAPKHAVASSNVGGLLFSFGRKSGDSGGGWWIIDEPELHLSANVLVPGLAGWRRENLPHLPETAAFEAAPDWICEVLSTRTARFDRIVKMELYAKAKVSFAWLIDPEAQLLEAYRLDAGLWVRLGAWAENAVARIPPFERMEFNLAMLWPD